LSELLAKSLFKKGQAKVEEFMAHSHILGSRRWSQVDMLTVAAIGWVVEMLRQWPSSLGPSRHWREGHVIGIERTDEYKRK